MRLFVRLSLIVLLANSVRARSSPPSPPAKASRIVQSSRTGFRSNHRGVDQHGWKTMPARTFKLVENNETKAARETGRTRRFAVNGAVLVSISVRRLFFSWKCQICQFWLGDFLRDETAGNLWNLVLFHGRLPYRSAEKGRPMLRKSGGMQNRLCEKCPTRSGMTRRSQRRRSRPGCQTVCFLPACPNCQGNDGPSTFQVCPSC